MLNCGIQHRNALWGLGFSHRCDWIWDFSRNWCTVWQDVICR